MPKKKKRGMIRWLRPNFQNPTGQSANQGTLGITDKTLGGKARKAEKLPSPKTLAEQAQSVRSALADLTEAATAAELCKQLKPARAELLSFRRCEFPSLGLRWTRGQ